jgi:hypothetical protein
MERYLLGDVSAERSRERTRWVASRSTTIVSPDDRAFLLPLRTTNPMIAIARFCAFEGHLSL